MQAQLQAQHRDQREAAQREQRERDREQQMADEADAATALWREEMVAAASSGTTGPGQQVQADDEVLQILLATRQQCLRDPAARAALLQLHAGAHGSSSAPPPAEWQQQLGLLFANGDNPKRQHKEDDI